jgi:hypothetical protein
VTAKPPAPVELDVRTPIWERVFTVAPLVIVGTRDPDGAFDLAPKHMALPLGWDNYFGFVCTPRHATWANAVCERAFTVSYPRPSQLVHASLTASPRCADGSKPAAGVLPTVPARRIEGALVDGAALQLECELERVIEGFGETFRAISFQQIRTSTMQSRAVAGVANGTYVFCVPGSSGACATAWDELIAAQLDYRTRPCNLVELMPRLLEK